MINYRIINMRIQDTSMIVQPPLQQEAITIQPIQLKMSVSQMSCVELTAEHVM